MRLGVHGCCLSGSSEWRSLPNQNNRAGCQNLLFLDDLAPAHYKRPYRPQIKHAAGPVYCQARRVFRRSNRPELLRFRQGSQNHTLPEAGQPSALLHLIDQRPLSGTRGRCAKLCLLAGYQLSLTRLAGTLTISCWCPVPATRKLASFAQTGEAHHRALLARPVASSGPRESRKFTLFGFVHVSCFAPDQKPGG